MPHTPRPQTRHNPSHPHNTHAMGIVSHTAQGLARGASNARRIITGKTANKNFYKGTGSGRMGRWTTRGMRGRVHPLRRLESP